MPRYVRVGIREWDLLPLDPNYGPDIGSTEFTVDFSVDVVLDRPVGDGERAD